MVRKHARRRVGVGLGLAVAMLVATCGLATTGGAAVAAADEGVTPKEIKIGFIYPATGVAASISASGARGVARQASIGRTRPGASTDARS